MVVVGGGVAGLSAAIEAAEVGQVILVDSEPRLGGSAWWGQAITALPDETAWPGDGVRARFRAHVQTEVLDWSRMLGVTWVSMPAKSTDSPPLVAPVGGGRRLTDVLWRIADQSGVQIHLSETVTDIDAGLTVHTAAGTSWSADAVVLACGGWAADLEGVRRRLGLGDVPLLGGGFPRADGSGIVLGEALGGVEFSPAGAVLYGHGTPDPEDPTRALVVLGTERMFAIDAKGAPQPELRSSRGATGDALLAMPGSKAWGILDGPTLASLQLQGSGVERRVSVEQAVVSTAATLPELAERIGVPAPALLAGVPPLLAQGPYGAVSLQAMAAKSLTGLSVDADGRLLDVSGKPITGLYAAGELSGFGGLYDDGVLMDSTMVAGAILSGRWAGAAVRADLSD